MSNRLDFDKIITVVLELFQEYLNETGMDLVANRLTDKNFNELINRDFPLNWSYIICDKNVTDGAFDFGLTWKKRNQLVAAFLSAYKPHAKCLEIYAIERLENGALDGKMMLLSLYACYLLHTFIDLKSIKAIDVEVTPNYAHFISPLGLKKLITKI